MPTLQAIETRYAGCRFRSRLEARWAVFFDAMGITWEYEPEGFTLWWRLSLTDGTFHYLPDFWLPDLGLWVEAKGSLTPDATVKLLNAAACLSSNGGGGCHDSGGNDLLVLGPVPNPTDGYMPILLHMHKGDLQGYLWPAERAHMRVGRDWLSGQDRTLASDTGGDIFGRGWTEPRVRSLLLSGRPFPYENKRSNIIRKFDKALAAARSARFEHGEHG